MMHKIVVILTVFVLVFSSPVEAQAQDWLGNGEDGVFELTGIDIIDIFLRAGNMIYYAIVNLPRNILIALFGEDNPILQAYDWFINLVEQVDRGLQVLGEVWETILRFTRPLFDFIVYVIENANKIIDLLRRMAELLINLAVKAFGWLVELVGIIIGTVTGFNNADLIPVPGVPQCVSAPQAWEICALWYILDWTVLAPGTPGENIIPIIVLVIDIVIIFYVVKWMIGNVRHVMSVFQQGD